MPLNWLTQVAPPSVVRRIVPPLPTAVPVFASLNQTLSSQWSVPLNWFTQVAPPSVVRRIVPPSPTAVPVFASLKQTPQRSSPVPLDWLTQVAPPSVVRRIVPPLPTVVPVFASVKQTPRRVLLVPLDWLTQVAPPSVVRRIVPIAPTAVPVFASVKQTSERLLPWGRGFCQNHTGCCGGSRAGLTGLSEQVLTARTSTRTARTRIHPRLTRSVLDMTPPSLCNRIGSCPPKRTFLEFLGGLVDCVILLVCCLGEGKGADKLWGGQGLAP